MIITKTENLQELCDKLAQEPFFALDTEFFREKTYYPKLCLIQVATKEIKAIIDPLADDIDLSPFYELLQNNSVKKIIHSSRQDIEIFYYLTGEVPKNIYDTQIASMVCGFGESISYEKLVNYYCDAELDKSVRLTDWTNRPLSAKQINYALSDVIYLVDIYEKLIENIKIAKRETWIEEEMNLITNKELYVSNPDEIWKKIKKKPPEKKKRVVLKELAKWRELKAIELNIPRKHVLNDNTLINMAKCYPTNLQNLKKTRYNNEIKELINNISDFQIDETTYYEPESQNLFSLIKILLKIKCEEYNVASKIIISKEDMIKFINGERDLSVLSGWRYDIFGQYALQLIDGEIVLGVKDKDVEIIIFNF